MTRIQNPQFAAVFLKVARRGGGFRQRRERQHGVALVVGLIMLIMVTLLSLAAMQSVRQQERIAGNVQQNALAFDKAETALGGAEHCAIDRCSDYPPVRIQEDFGSDYGTNNSDVTVTAPLDQESVASWNTWKRKLYDGYYRNGNAIDRLYRSMGEKPWVVMEQLPNVVSDESLEAGKKRDTEVIRTTILSSNDNPASSDATVVVILQTVLWR